MGEAAVSKMRLGLVGPVLPFRGGIAQHTTMLHRTLSARVELTSVSFKRQYPKLLYPGRDDISPEHREHCEAGVHYLIDSLNPATWLKAGRLFTHAAISSVVIPWWTVFWAPCFGFIAGYLRKRKVRILFLCHNVSDHDPTFWKELLSRKTLSKGDFFLATNRADADRLFAMMPDARVAVYPLPVSQCLPPAVSSVRKRARLELLFFGFVRPYKGLDVLVEAMRLLKGEDVFLTIAGEWWQKLAPLRQALHDPGILNKIEVVDRYITEVETAFYFSRADAVVLPYLDASGSGVVPLAYHYSKPVIATKVGGLIDVVEDGVSGRLVQPGDPSALASVIREFLHSPAPVTGEGVRRVSERMTWDGLATSLLKLAEET